VLFFERPYDTAAARRREPGRIGNRDAKHNLEGVLVRPFGDEDGGASARMAQTAGVVISLEFERIAIDRR
jgi:hypothetical protein